MNNINNTKSKKKEYEIQKQPKEIVLFQHIDKTFSIPLWIPFMGIVLGLLGEVCFFFIKKK